MVGEGLGVRSVVPAAGMPNWIEPALTPGIATSVATSEDESTQFRNQIVHSDREPLATEARDVVERFVG